MTSLQTPSWRVDSGGGAPAGPSPHHLVRESWAAGWALSGGPLGGDRFTAGCLAAQDLAESYPDEHTLIEATLQIAKLEGTWARVFADREDVHTHHGPQVTAAYRALAKATMDVRGEVARFRRAVANAQHADIRTAATAAAVRLVQAAVDPGRPEYRAAVAALRDAISAAVGTGMDAGLLVAGPREAAPPPDPRSDADRNSEAAAALHRIIRGNTTDVANALTRLAAEEAQDDADREDRAAEQADAMVEDVEDATSGDSERASALLGDETIGSSFLDGMVSAFVSIGLRQMAWVTAGDGKVCGTCTTYEDQSPYPAIMVPDTPHPRCRCVIEPA